MKSDRKKQLMLEYKNRRPEKGVVSYKCTVTGDEFLGITQDVNAFYNSMSVKLNSGSYPNKELQSLWNAHGEAGFERELVKALKYDNPQDNHMKELEKLRDECFEERREAKKLWL